MATEVIMPALGMAQDSGRVLRWHKAAGDTVEAGEPLLEIETDKVTVDVEAPASGVLGRLRASAGDDVPVGGVVAAILGAGEQEPADDAAGAAERAAAAAAPTAPARVTDGEAPRERTLASPKARRLAAERGVAVETLVGSGPGGAITSADVDGADSAAPSPVWRRMAERVSASWRDVPHFYLQRDLDVSNLVAWREAARADPALDGITYTDALVRCAAGALRHHGDVNARWEDGRSVRSAEVNVGLAIALEDGLVVGVVHGADRLGIADIAARRKHLVDAAQAGALEPRDVDGGTFTLSNLGGFGVDSFAAIVNAPQAAILAVGRIRDCVVAVGGAPTVRPVLSATLSFDHRIVDGARGAAFLDTFARLVEAAELGAP